MFFTHPPKSYRTQPWLYLLLSFIFNLKSLWIDVEETYENGSVYIGEKYLEKRHGEGRFYYHDGGYYEGTWYEG